MRNEVPKDRPKLIVAVTVGTSAFALLRGQLEWFKRSGWDVTLVSNPDEDAKRAAAREGVPLIGINMRRAISPFKDLTSLLKWVYVLKNKSPDAINVGTPKAALLGITAAWLVRVPKRLYTVRGLRLEGTSGVLYSVLWCMEWLTMHLATDVLYVSKSLAEEADRQGLLIRSKSWTIGSGSSNGVNAQAIHDWTKSVDRNSRRAELGFKPNDFVAGFIGRMTLDKGIDTLLEAFEDPRLDKNIQGLLIGKIEDSSLAEEIESLGDRVKLVPWTDDVWGYLPIIDVICLPTLREGFPNVVLEAGAAGVPAITTRATGAIDSVVSGRTGMLIDVGDSPALVDNLNQLCGNRALTRRLGRASKKRVFEEFARETIWEGIEEILSETSSPKHAIRANN